MIATMRWSISRRHSSSLAVEALLDRVLPCKVPNDTTVYSLGRLHRLPVVVASLPRGIKGNNAAATSCANTLRSFTNIGYMFFCGIAGGAPDPTQAEFDVRLGDVVYSDLRGGVVQYDSGKQYPGGFTATRVPMQAPSRAISQLVDALHRAEQHNEASLGERIASVAATVPDRIKRTGYKYARPSSSVDRLYNPSFGHRAADLPCIDCCPESEVVQRTARQDGDGPLRVFPGCIASGNLVMKDGVSRESIRRQHQVLCFEMEGAGLVEALTQHDGNVSYFIIRGICDYSDSHKNKVWQEYAAAVAAAFFSLIIELQQKLSPADEDHKDSPSDDPPQRRRGRPSISSSSSSSSSFPSSGVRLSAAEREANRARGSLDEDYPLDEQRQSRWNNEHEPEVQFLYDKQDYYASGEAGARIRSIGSVFNEPPGFAQPVFFSAKVMEQVVHPALFRRTSDGNYMIYLGDIKQYFTEKQQKKLRKCNISSTGNFVTAQIRRDTGRWV
jgi:nucleoside phosphorylase